MFLPLSFRDSTGRDWAVYDVQMLLDPESAVEADLMLAALQRIPLKYLGSADAWGEVRSHNCLWVNRTEHDGVYAEIRNRLMSDAAFLRTVEAAMIRDVEALETTLRTNAEKDLWHSLVDAVTWVSTNWLNPQSAIRMSVRRLAKSTEDERQRLFASLLVGDHRSLLASAYRATLEEGAAEEPTFWSKWRPAFLGATKSEFAATVRLGQATGDLRQNLDALAANQQRRSASDVAWIIDQASRCDGPAASALLAAQISFVQTCVWQEEARRMYQAAAVDVLHRSAESSSPLEGI